MKLGFPTIDGHFWVVRNGIIIDPDFSMYDFICKVNGCDKKSKDYLPAPMLTQTLMIGIFTKCLKNIFGDKEFKELCGDFLKISKHLGLSNPKPNSCFQNCLMEIAERGGDLVFGSLGFKKNNYDGYFYEYGGTNYKTIADFIKK